MKKLLAEVAGIGLVVAGVALWSLPAALIAAGTAIVVSIEVRG